MRQNLVRLLANQSYLLASFVFFNFAGLAIFVLLATMAGWIESPTRGGKALFPIYIGAALTGTSAVVVYLFSLLVKRKSDLVSESRMNTLGLVQGFAALPILGMSILLLQALGLGDIQNAYASAAMVLSFSIALTALLFIIPITWITSNRLSKQSRNR